MPVVSIIIPVYNVEKYVGKCLDSIFSQRNVKEEDYEVVVVNDGSTDGSMAVVDRYRTHGNMRLIEQENKKQGEARNNGVRNSKGEYIWFIDGDDFIDDGALQAFIDIIRSKQPEVIAMRYKKLYEKDGKVEIIGEKGNDGFMTMRQFVGRGLGSGCVWAYLFQRSFYENRHLSFLPYVFHEDVEFYAKFDYYCERVYVCFAPFYNYLIRFSGSTMSTFDIKKSYDLLFIAGEIIRFKREEAKGWMKKICLNRHATNALLGAVLPLKPYYGQNNTDVEKFLDYFDEKIKFSKYWKLYFHWPLTKYRVYRLTTIFLSSRCFLRLYPEKD